MHPGSGEFEVVDRMLFAEHQDSRPRGKRSLPSDARRPPMAETRSTTTSGASAGLMSSRMSRAVRWMLSLAPGTSGFTTPPPTLADTLCPWRLICPVFAMTSGTRDYRQALYASPYTGPGVREIWW